MVTRTLSYTQDYANNDRETFETEQILKQYYHKERIENEITTISWFRSNLGVTQRREDEDPRGGGETLELELERVRLPFLSVRCFAYAKHRKRRPIYRPGPCMSDRLG